MPRLVKEKYIGGRVDQSYFDKVITYILATNLTQGDLVRLATEEYMINHPIKTIDPINQLKGDK